MHRCYVPPKFIDDFLYVESKLLPAMVKERFIRIVRVKNSEMVSIFDGRGREIVGVLEIKTKEEVFLRKQKLIKKPRKFPLITLLQAAISEKKIIETIARATEYGIDFIRVFHAKRSDRFVINKLKRRLPRLMSIASDAARQSGRLYIPEIHISEELPTIESGGDCVGYYGDINGKWLTENMTAIPDKHHILICIGPEGGFMKEEMDSLKNNGFIGVRFAPHVLRTELAVLAPLSIINGCLKR